MYWYIRSGTLWVARSKLSTMRKRVKSDNFICSCIPDGAQGTTMDTGLKRKSGKRTAVPLSWEVLTLGSHRPGLGCRLVRAWHSLVPPRPAWSWLTNTLDQALPLRLSLILMCPVSPYVRVCVFSMCISRACARKAATEPFVFVLCPVAVSDSLYPEPPTVRKLYWFVTCLEDATRTVQNRFCVERTLNWPFVSHSGMC